MKFEIDFDKIKAAGMEYAGKGMDMANDLADRAKRETKILNDQNKLAKAQRELGALVYSLARRGESNQPLLDKYIDTISALEQEIDQLRAQNAPAQATTETVESVYVDVPEEQPVSAQRTCPVCGAPVSEDALFCNNCGAQL